MGRSKQNRTHIIFWSLPTSWDTCSDNILSILDQPLLTARLPASWPPVSASARMRTCACMSVHACAPLHSNISVLWDGSGASRQGNICDSNFLHPTPHQVPFPKIRPGSATQICTTPLVAEAGTDTDDLPRASDARPTGRHHTFRAPRHRRPTRPPSKVKPPRNAKRSDPPKPAEVDEPAATDPAEDQNEWIADVLSGAAEGPSHAQWSDRRGSEADAEPLPVWVSSKARVKRPARVPRGRRAPSTANAGPTASKTPPGRSPLRRAEPRGPLAALPQWLPLNVRERRPGGMAYGPRPGRREQVTAAGLADALFESRKSRRPVPVPEPRAAAVCEDGGGRPRPRPRPKRAASVVAETSIHTPSGVLAVPMIVDGAAEVRLADYRADQSPSAPGSQPSTARSARGSPWADTEGTGVRDAVLDRSGLTRFAVAATSGQLVDALSPAFALQRPEWSRSPASPGDSAPDPAMSCSSNGLSSPLRSASSVVLDFPEPLMSPIGPTKVHFYVNKGNDIGTLHLKPAPRRKVCGLAWEVYHRANGPGSSRVPLPGTPLGGKT